MGMGLPYDSDEGRAFAAAITSLMGGTAYKASAEMAGAMDDLGSNPHSSSTPRSAIQEHFPASTGT